MKVKLISTIFLISIGSGAMFAQEVRPQDQQTEITAPAKQEAEVKNLFELIQDAGIWMIPLVLLALVGFTLVIERIITFSRSGGWGTSRMQSYLEEKAKSSSAQTKEDLAEELEEYAQLYINELEKTQGFLMGIGSLAPLMGFFGTVVGMITAFADIASRDNVNAKVVASGIQIALITTAGGLAIAIPVSGAFYVFGYFIQRQYNFAEAFIEEKTRGLKRRSEV